LNEFNESFKALLNFMQFEIIELQLNICWVLYIPQQRFQQFRHQRYYVETIIGIRLLSQVILQSHVVVFTEKLQQSQHVLHCHELVLRPISKVYVVQLILYLVVEAHLFLHSDLVLQDSIHQPKELL
jgi:hypothetical protein